MADSSQRVPTIIVTGFLGSGKTTLITHWIDELQGQGQQVVYIKNEIGDADLDGKLLQAKGIQARELLNGCICCTLVGPFTTSITEAVQQFHPDRIIIEASGSADTTALALMVSAHPLLSREVVISIVDVLNFEGFQDLSITAQAQTKFTDLIIFNKVELADDHRKEQVVGYVRELNQHSPIIEAKEGKVPLSLITGVNTSELNALLAKHNHHETHHETEDQLQGCQLQPPSNWQKHDWETWLNQLPKTVFRVKGCLQIAGEWWLLNRVATRHDWQLLSSQEYQQLEPILIVIGFLIKDQQTTLQASLA